MMVSLDLVLEAQQQHTVALVSSAGPEGKKSIVWQPAEDKYFVEIVRGGEVICDRQYDDVCRALLAFNEEI